MDRAIAAIGACVLLTASAASAQTLRGSRASVDRQYTVAVQHDYTFLDNTKDVRRFVDLGLIVPVRENENLELAEVSFPYARPGVRTFVERLAAQYRSACGERLVITSLTRPTGKQPRNASDQSVHPAGMAVDLRVSRSAKCRAWLERVLLQLERTGVLDATRERRPAHYHVAVFPRQYLTYVAQLENRSGTRLASAAAPGTTTVAAKAADAPAAAATADVHLASASTTAPANADAAPDGESQQETIDYRVNRGDTLWSIARRHGTSVQELKELNGLRSSRIAAGQIIIVPAGGN